MYAWLAGAFFAADLVLWHHSIDYVGAGLATVLGNTQVLMVGLLAWVLLNERLSNRALVSIPLAFGGVVLISGVLEDGAYGENPALGVVLGILTGIAYSGFLLALRQGSSGNRRGRATVRRHAGSCCRLSRDRAGRRRLRRVPGLGRARAGSSVLALSSQVLGWLLIAVSLPRLPAVGTSLLIMLQPVLAVILAAWLVEESPSVLQLAGAGLDPRGGRACVGPAPGPRARARRAQPSPARR